MSVFWTAEIGSNHNNSMDRALKLIDTAKEVGADAVKFQLFDPHKLYTQSKDETNEDFNKKIKLLEERALNPNWIPKLSEYCKNIDIKFGCTPFTLESVDILAPYVDFLKISSFDILRKDLIDACLKACKEKNMVLYISTGLILNYDEMERILSSYSLSDLNYIVLLHCSSKYPSSPIECDLYRIKQYRKYFPYLSGIGWSDHSVNSGVIHRAVGEGAEWIEFHFDLEDQQGSETICGHCWEPSKIEKVIKDVKDGEIAISFETNYNYQQNVYKMRKSLADPSDGSRPCKEYRK
jgi:N-acetylneuraminate synthase